MIQNENSRGRRPGQPAPGPLASGIGSWGRQPTPGAPDSQVAKRDALIRRASGAPSSKASSKFKKVG